MADTTSVLCAFRWLLTLVVVWSLSRSFAEGQRTSIETINATNREGRTALGSLVYEWSSGFGKFDSATAEIELHQLLELGADPLAAEGPGSTRSVVEVALGTPYVSVRPVDPLEHRYRLTSVTNTLPLFSDLLLTNRASIARRTPSGDTALHLAARWGRTNALDGLLSSGFSVNQTNDHGLTPLQSLAAESLGEGIPVEVRQLYARGPGNDLKDSKDDGIVLAAALVAGNNRFLNQYAEPPPLADRVGVLLSRGAAFNVFSAAGLARTDALAEILSTNAPVAKARDGFSRTPLHYAASASATRAIAMLLAAGADPSAATVRGVSPIHVAVLGTSEPAETLLNAGASPASQTDLGDTPLHLACQWGRTNFFATLLRYGVQLNITNRFGETPLCAAVRFGESGFVTSLLEAGADARISPVGYSLLHIASMPEIVSALLRAGLAADTRDGDGRTPLQRAIASQDWDCINLFLLAGADINAADNEGNSTLHQHMLRGYDLIGRVEGMPRTQTNVSITAWLIEHGANPFRTNREGRTPLHVFCASPAAQYGLLGVGSHIGLIYESQTNQILALLRGGAKEDEFDAIGLTALHLAASNASPAALGILIRRAASVDSPRGPAGRTVLHYAASSRNGRGSDATDRIALLLAAGADPNAQDKQGWTPLHVAMQQEWALAARILLDQGANINATNAVGQRPFDLLRISTNDFLAPTGSRGSGGF